MSVPFLIVRTHSAEQTAVLGEHLGRILAPGELLLLVGDLGTGKTTFVRGLATGLEVPGRVRSPSFTFVQTHHGGRYPLVHADLYRCDDPREVIDLGLDELMAPPAVSVVEWGDKAGTLTGGDHLELDFAWDDDVEDTRTIAFHPSGRWRSRMGELGEAVRTWAAQED